MNNPNNQARHAGNILGLAPSIWEHQPDSHLSPMGMSFQLIFHRASLKIERENEQNENVNLPLTHTKHTFNYLKHAARPPG